MNNNHDYDVLIVGGGMVGASMACALANQPLTVGVIEAIPFRSDNQPSYDARSIALAYGSGQIFQRLGLWQAISPNSTAIKKIHISDRGNFGTTRLDSTTEQVPALGYVVENRVIGQALKQAFNRYDNLHLICPATLQDIDILSDHAKLSIFQHGRRQKLTAKLIIAADGGHSIAREKAGISVHQSDYQQTAIISTVTPNQAHHNIAYERFTGQGPVALLPMSNNRCSMVLTCHHENSQAICSLNDTDFLAHLQHQFGYRLGKFIRTSQRVSYPLILTQANQYYRHRLVLIGNAAQTLHPIAGQGFNLGIRDVATLAQIVIQAQQAQQDIGQTTVLHKYAQWRKRDQRQVTAFTNGLTRFFSNRFPPLMMARSLGLITINNLPPLKHKLATYAMGMGSKLPKFTSGVPL